MTEGGLTIMAKGKRGVGQYDLFQQQPTIPEAVARKIEQREHEIRDLMLLMSAPYTAARPIKCTFAGQLTKGNLLKAFPVGRLKKYL